MVVDAGRSWAGAVLSIAQRHPVLWPISAAVKKMTDLVRGTALQREDKCEASSELMLWMPSLIVSLLSCPSGGHKCKAFESRGDRRRHILRLVGLPRQNN